MPEPFKNRFNQALIDNMANHFAKNHPTFNAQLFIKLASHNLTTLELKARSNQIMQAMQQTLPDNLIDCAPIIVNSLANAKSATDEASFLEAPLKEQHKGIDGWAIMPIADYIGIQALNNIEALGETRNEANSLAVIDTAMSLFKAVTQRFSAEFGIRHLLFHYPTQTLAVLERWVDDPNQHVRRLISEGTRPRLPWGMQLPTFIKQPTLILPLLEKLKNDNEEYVRRSVANNLNDIAKDHPALVASVAEQWLADDVVKNETKNPAQNKNKNKNKNTQRLVRHACRTLLKNGQPKVLTVFGYHPPEINDILFELSPSTVVLGNSVTLNLTINSASKASQALMIDFIIHHQKANGTTSAKVFKWSTKTLHAGQTLRLSKQQIIKAITTRKYYSGLHQIDVLINGEKIASQPFDLQVPN